MEDIKPSLMELVDGDDFFHRILVQSFLCFLCVYFSDGLC